MGKKNYNKQKYYHEYNSENTENKVIGKPDYWYYIYDDNDDFKLRCCF
jgi:hypothetical protein